MDEDTPLDAQTTFSSPHFRQPAADLSSKAGETSSAIRRHFRSFLQMVSLAVKHLMPLRTCISCQPLPLLVATTPRRR